MGKKRSLLLLLMLSVYLGLNNLCSTASPKQHDDPRSRLNSSVIFPIHGNVYPRGLYYVTLNIGDPPKPYYLDIDTGSDLTWLQCDAPCVSCSPGPHPFFRPKSNKLVPCEDPICTSIHTLSSEKCKIPDEQCDYEIAYADEGSSRGVLVKDAFTFPLANGSLVKPLLAFGCGYNQQGSNVASPSPTDGMLGLGRGKASIVSQLQDLGLTRNVVGHCLSRQGGGYLFLGDGFVPFSGVTWTPMSCEPVLRHYSPGPADLFFGEQPMGVRGHPVIFDSGSTYTYFESRVYKAFISAVMKNLLEKQLKEAPEDKTLVLCWKGKEMFKSVLDVKKIFKPLALVFANGERAKLEIPPEGYLIISSKGNVCLGILNGTEIGLENSNIIGDISMQGLMVIYDNEQQQIGWAPSDCDKFPYANGGEDDFKNRFSQPYAARSALTHDCAATYPFQIDVVGRKQ